MKQQFVYDKIIYTARQLNKANLATDKVCKENKPKPWFYLSIKRQTVKFIHKQIRNAVH